MATANTLFEHPPTIKRAFTLPTRLQRSPSPAPLAPDAARNATEAETLFAHPHVRIVKFPAPPLGFAQKDNSLPWTKPNERTEAAGVVRLYKLRGQHAAFLHSGDLLLSLMPRSQCWCVDGISKFALRLQMFIYRIELPYETDQDKACVEDFKRALDKVLLYERTACAFKRSFQTEVKEEQVSPLPVKRLTRTNTKAKRWAFDEGWRPEGAEKPTPPERKGFPFPRRRSGSSSPPVSDEESRLSNANSHETLSTYPTSASGAEAEPYVVGQVKRLEATRSISGPPKLVHGQEDPFAGEDGEDQSMNDLAPTPQYVPLRAVQASAPHVQAHAAAQEERAIGFLHDSPRQSPEPPLRPTRSKTFPALANAQPLQASEALDDDQARSGDEEDAHETSQGFPAFTSGTQLQAIEETPQPSEPFTLIASESPVSPTAESPAPAQIDFAMQSNSSTTSSLQTFRTANSTFSPSTGNSPIIGTAATAFTPVAGHDASPPQPQEAPAPQTTTPPLTPNPSSATPPKTPQAHLRSATTKPDPTPPTSPPSTIKPRPSQMLRQFRSRRPSTPSKYSTATARGLNLDLSAPYLRNDPLPMVPYGASSNQGVISATLGLLMGPPAGLVQVMMQIAARVTSASSFTVAEWECGIEGAGEQGGAYYRRKKGRWVPGGWDDEDAESEQSDEEVFEEAVE